MPYLWGMRPTQEISVLDRVQRKKTDKRSAQVKLFSFLDGGVNREYNQRILNPTYRFGLVWFSLVWFGFIAYEP